MQEYKGVHYWFVYSDLQAAALAVHDGKPNDKHLDQHLDQRRCMHIPDVLAAARGRFCIACTCADGTGAPSKKGQSTEKLLHGVPLPFWDTPPTAFLIMAASPSST